MPRNVTHGLLISVVKDALAGVVTITQDRPASGDFDCTVGAMSRVGTIDEYHLTIGVHSTGITVKADSSKKSSRQLPGCCPQRHINLDGSFCLGYNQPVPTTEGAAEEWWHYLIHFLIMQRRAEVKGKWPSAEVAHGGAAVPEIELKAALNALPRHVQEIYGPMAINIEEALSNGLRTNSAGDKLINQLGPCVCGNKLVRKECSICQEYAPTIVSLKRKYQAELNAFWFSLQQRKIKCCGSAMEGCKLKASYAPTVLSAGSRSC